MANPDGTPIWFELVTAEPDTARAFYAAVAGWTIAPSPMDEHGGYLIASAPDGDGVGGLMAPPPGTDPLPGWNVYFATGDVDAMAERIEELGGSIAMPPMDIPHVGRFAIAADPQGVWFTIMKGDSPEDSTAFRPSEPGATTSIGHGIWIELATPDPDGALAFYGALFGWEKQGAMPMGEMGDYSFIGSGDFRPGAIMSSTTTGAPARWSWYVHVPDIDAAIATAAAAGGLLVAGPNQIPGGDYSANLTDPAGHAIGLVGPRPGDA